MLEKLKNMLDDYLENKDVEITMDTSFNDELGLDSLDLFELVTSLEDEYAIEIAASDMPDLTTVGKIVGYLEALGITQ